MRNGVIVTGILLLHLGFCNSSRAASHKVQLPNSPITVDLPDEFRPHPNGNGIYVSKISKCRITAVEYAKPLNKIKEVLNKKPPEQLKEVKLKSGGTGMYFITRDKAASAIGLVLLVPYKETSYMVTIVVPDKTSEAEQTGFKNILFSTTFSNITKPDPLREFGAKFDIANSNFALVNYNANGQMASLIYSLKSKGVTSGLVEDRDPHLMATRTAGNLSGVTAEKVPPLLRKKFGLAFSVPLNCVADSIDTLKGFKCTARGKFRKYENADISVYLVVNEHSLFAITAIAESTDHMADEFDRFAHSMKRQ